MAKKFTDYEQKQWESDEPLYRVDVLSKAEPHILSGFNQTRGWVEGTLPELFEEQVERRPEVEAVVYGEERLTYRELNRRANQLGHYLRERGVRSETAVGICFQRSMEMVVAILGVLKAGGAYVPLDPEYPEERLRYMLKDAEVELVVTAGGLQGLCSNAGVRCIDLDAEGEEIAGQPEGNVPGRITSENLAYIIYTSGSTGIPKGTAVPHRSVMGFMCDVDYVTFDENQTLFQHSSTSWDALTLELWPALVHGGKCVLHAGEAITASDLRYAIQHHGVTVLWLTSALFNSLMDSDPDALAGLKQLMVGGEALSPTHIGKALQLLPETRIVNGYGPSECTVFATCYPIPAQPEPLTSIPIGRPIGDRQVFLVDENLTQVPIGVAGEILIGGEAVARGYVGRPELTAEKFIPDPFSREAGARMYRTGDLGRWRSDGTIEFVGRNDEQVKVREARIELGEVEAILHEHAGVSEAVVMVREDGAGGKTLVAYYTCEKGEEDMGAEQLRAHVEAKLPPYMVPAGYVRLEQMPLTANGKLDRKALPAPDEAAYGIRGYEAPVGEMEQTLAGIWAEVLKVERVGRHDNFFALGGHSLRAVWMIARMQQNGLKVKMPALFDNPTIVELAAVVGQQESRIEIPPNLIPLECEVITPEMLPLIALTTDEIKQIVRGVPGGAGNVQDIYPLAPLQEGIFFHYLLAGESDPYVAVLQLTFDYRRRVQRYIEALQAMIERHDILRTATMWEGLREPAQVVWRKAVLAVEEVELDPTRGDVAQQLYERYHPRRCRIDVRQAPLLRLYVAEDKIQAHWLMMLVLHHLVMDHNTMEALQTEIQAHMQGEANRLLAPPPFRNLVAEARLGGSKEEHEGYFRRLLGDVDEPTAPFGLLDVQGDGSGIQEAEQEVDGGLAHRMREQARALKVSAATLCHLAWAMVLGRLTGRDDVVFGTVLLGRMQGAVGSERGMGLFINTLPVRIQVGRQSVEDCVRNTQKQLADVLQHEHASLALAQRCSAVAAPAPLFTSLLNYRHNAAPDASSLAASSSDQEVWEGIRVLFGEERTNYPFTLSVDDMEKGFALTAQVRGVMEPRRICRLMCTALESVVKVLEEDTKEMVCNLNVLGEEERRQVLYEWNQTQVEIPEKCLPELFEEQVERRPEAEAVVYGEERLTYRELNKKANRLAHYLKYLGVRPEVQIAICMERSVEMVIAVLGVLKAGGAYVALDPEYPEERLQYMLKDSAPMVVLTQSHLGGRFAEQSEGLLITDLADQSAPWKQHPERDLDGSDLGLTPENAAYVIYTSGSTGNPKGVVVTHRGIRSLVVATAERLGLGTKSRVLQFASLNFDASLWEIAMALTQGAALVLRGKEEGSGAALREIIMSQGITHALLPLGVLGTLEEYGELPLEVLIVGGEACSGAVVARWSEGRRMVNAYGPTEATVAASISEPLWGGETPSIGKPISNTKIYILDDHMEAVPIGVAGELYIAGLGLARGYLNRAEQTGERFVPNPYERPGARMYRTGDLGRWRSDGTIEFVGRSDLQVKVRGFRIELGEIEASLQEHARVSEAVVMVREDRAGGRTLVAYYTCEEGEEDVGAEQLRAHVEAKLPPYMVPAGYVRLERMPLTANGKLDRKALPAPDEAAYGVRGYEAPVGEMEQTLAGIWAEVLKVERVGRHDNFFALGGHSLLTIQLVNQVRQKLGADLAVRTLFEAPTVAELALRLNDRSLKKDFDRVIPLRPTGNLRAIFCLPPGGGLSWSYAGLLPAVEVNRPIYGLEASDSDISAKYPETIEATAEEYLTIIRRVQGQGPYHLLGWSLGGLVAHSVACQLQLQNQEVGLLALLDAYPYSPSEPAPALDRESLRKQLVEGMTKLVEQDARHTPSQPHDLSLMIKAAHQARLLAPDVKDFERVVHIYEYLTKLRREFRPSRFHGNVLLFVASDSGAIASPDVWTPYIHGKISIHRMNCRHIDIGKPVEMGVIGRTLATYLQAIEVDFTGSPSLLAQIPD